MIVVTFNPYTQFLNVYLIEAEVKFFFIYFHI